METKITHFLYIYFSTRILSPTIRSEFREIYVASINGSPPHTCHLQKPDATTSDIKCTNICNGLLCVTPKPVNVSLLIIVNQMSSVAELMPYKYCNCFVGGGFCLRLRRCR